MTTKPDFIFVGMPLGPDRRAHFEAALALASGADSINYKYKREEVTADISRTTSSLIDVNCTSLLAYAFNHGATYFAMLHSDVCPQHDWLLVLFEEMKRTNAKMISAVVPFKSDSGQTSTAVETNDEWTPRILNLSEMKENDTFTMPGLLLNTGCFLIKLDDRDSGLLYFDTVCRLRKDIKTDKVRTVAMSEDWNFTRLVRATYGDERIMATTKVLLYHGNPAFSNQKGLMKQ